MAAIVGIVLAGLLIVGVSRCVAAKDERITTNQDRAKVCTDAGHILRREAQGRRDVRFTYWCTNEDGFLYDLWFDSGRDYRKGPEVR